MPTSLAYDDMLSALREAVEAEGMLVVSEAGPIEAAASRGHHPRQPGRRRVSQ